ncbi:MAG TPA: phosphoglycerate kinase [Candidatus Saccharibacteria bacterium]|nr:phosphoglycerate kinase [Candidatus Saccharibacteria bacterium]HMR38290.1 phosphoglycerate kinase [Candidatus Saccharibacteria bacterium]
MSRVGFQKRTVRTTPLEHKTVLVRADYNVPLKEDGSIADDFRIRASVPTIKYLLEHDCKVVIMSHLGRPDGAPTTEFSLTPVAKRLAELLGHKVEFVDDCIGPKVSQAVRNAKEKSVILLENLRFHAEEEANDSAFANKIATDSLAQYFIQDGFGVVHRAHASTDAITHFLPSVAGLLLEREFVEITNAMHAPRRPFLALLGGAKVSDKIEVIESLAKVADQIVIGGAMANTFLANKGYSLGKSKVETDQSEVIDRIWHKVREKAGEDMQESFLVLPTDLAVDDPSVRKYRRMVAVDQVPEDTAALDIGDQSIERMAKAINRAQTIIWNGTMGMAEYEPFAHGSARAALELAMHPEKTSIIGGGDTADFVINWDAKQGESFTHVSTGGGASLELMAGRNLPGIEALLDA